MGYGCYNPYPSFSSLLLFIYYLGINKIKEEFVMQEILGKTARVAVGLGCAAIAAELVAIGAHAAIVDGERIISKAASKLTKQPEVKKGLFKRR